jgi:hypothetical protein
MRSFKIAILFAACLFLALPSAQSTGLPIGGWRVHLPYKNGQHITGSNTTIWTATDDGLFSLNRADNAVERITKIEGLSDLAIGALNYNPHNNTLVIGYKNGNIDFIRDKQITNLPDIKRAQIIGDKNIYNIYFVNQFAYVATGFGIVVIDTDRNEVKETYFIGLNGANVEVHDLISDGTLLYAATVNGIYFANINDPFITNFTSWNRFTAIPILNVNPLGFFTSLEIFNNQLIASYEPTYPILTYNQGKVLKFDLTTSTWTEQTPLADNITDLYVRNNQLYFAGQGAVYRYNTSYVLSEVYYLAGANEFLQPSWVYVTENDEVWEADHRYGMVHAISSFGGFSYYPNGPVSTSAYWMDQQNSVLISATGGHDDAWNNVYNVQGLSVYDGSNWATFSGTQYPALDTMYDMISCVVDPKDTGHYFLGSWGEGILEINNGAVQHTWDNSNSTLDRRIEYQWVGIGGMAFDTSGQLWVVNSHVLSTINVYTRSGQWLAFDFTGVIPNGTYASEIVVTQSGQKWVILPRGGGMLVFDEQDTYLNTSDDKKKKLGFNSGQGSLPGAEVHCLAEDLDGEIWVGTDKGIGVFYCPENIFTTSGCEAQQILIEQDGYTQILLETQVVTAIAVDGANRKWIGTEGGGLFLMSADGTEQIAHFEASNSPLLSDNITSIAIDQKTGEVFIGTDKGIVSYRGEATLGEATMGDVYAFPNPVRHEYTGPIAITGLVKDGDVKITDIAGNLIYKTTALGGQAIWDGNNFKGERAASGVYFVLISNEDGTEKAVTKILLIN